MSDIPLFEQHKLFRDRVYPSGAILLTCPICGRQVVIGSTGVVSLDEGEYLACHDWNGGMIQVDKVSTEVKP